MVFQNYALYPHMTVRDNMGFALKLAGVDKDEINRKVEEAAKILDLEQHLDRKPANLSGGQRDPSVFLMDEPLSNLDAKLRVQMRTEVSRIQSRTGTTTVYVTHDQTEAMTLGDRVAVMRLGELQQVGTPKELYENPVNLFVAGFIGSPAMNFFAATVDGGRVRLPIGEVELSDELRQRVEARADGAGSGSTREVIAGVRPEDFEDAELVDRQHHPHGYEFEVTIDLVESMGSEIYAYFAYEGEGASAEQIAELAQDAGATEVPGADGQQVVARLNPDSKVARGERARLWMDTTKLHLFDPQTGHSLTRAD
jgi:multiple sugar transport system ATP-binding protein